MTVSQCLKDKFSMPVPHCTVHNYSAMVRAREAADMKGWL